MEDKRDHNEIDKLFSESFRDFKPDPSDKVWKHLDARLAKNELGGHLKKTTYLKISLASALLFLALLGYYAYRMHSLVITLQSDRNYKRTMANAQPEVSERQLVQKEFLSTGIPRSTRDNASRPADNPTLKSIDPLLPARGVTLPGKEKQLAKPPVSSADILLSTQSNVQPSADNPKLKNTDPLSPARGVTLSGEEKQLAKPPVSSADIPLSAQSNVQPPADNPKLKNTDPLSPARGVTLSGKEKQLAKPPVSSADTLLSTQSNVLQFADAPTLEMHDPQFFADSVQLTVNEPSLMEKKSTPTDTAQSANDDSLLSVSAVPLSDAAPADETKTLSANFFSHLSLAGFYSPDFTQSTPSGATAPANQIKENPLYSFSSGINLGIDITKHLHIQTGIFYSDYNLQGDSYVKFEVKKEEDDEEEDEDEKYRVVHTSSGDVKVQCDGEKGGDEDRTVIYNYHLSQHFSYLNVPLRTAFAFGSEKLSGFVSAGVNLSILIEQRTGVTFLNHPVYTEERVYNNITGLRKFNYGIIVAAGVRSRIYKGLYIEAGPTFRHVLMPTNRGGAQSYLYTVGGALGIGYHF